MKLATRIDDAQGDRPWLSFPFAVVKRFSEHNGGRLSAAVAFFAFFSIFPLLVVFVSVLDLVREGNPELRADLVDSTVGNLPLIGSRIDAPASAASGGIVPIVIGLAVALWAGLGVTSSLDSAFATVWDVRPDRRPNFLIARAKGLLALLAIALLVALSTLAGNIAALLGAGVIAFVMGVLLNLVVNVLGLLALFYFLTPNDYPWRSHVPGAVVGGAGVLVLQQFGSAIARRYVENASDTYGTLAVVIGLLVWLHFVTRLVILSAEINAVKARSLHPRSLADDVVSEADRRAMLLNTERVLYDEAISPTVEVPESEPGLHDVNARSI